MKRTSPAQWAEIKASYQRGEGSCRELADKFNVSEHAVEKRCQTEQWRKKQSEHLGRVSELVAESVARPVIDVTRKVIEGFLKDLERIENVWAQAADLSEPVDVRHLLVARKTALEALCDLGVIQKAPDKVEHSGQVNTISDDLREHLIKIREELASRPQVNLSTGVHRLEMYS